MPLHDLDKTMQGFTVSAICESITFLRISPQCMKNDDINTHNTSDFCISELCRNLKDLGLASRDKQTSKERKIAMLQ